MNPSPLPAMDLARRVKRLFPKARVAVFPHVDRRTTIAASIGERRADVTVMQPVDGIGDWTLSQIAGGALLRQLYPQGWAQA